MHMRTASTSGVLSMTAGGVRPRPHGIRSVGRAPWTGGVAELYIRIHSTCRQLLTHFVQSPTLFSSIFLYFLHKCKQFYRKHYTNICKKEIELALTHVKVAVVPLANHRYHRYFPSVDKRSRDPARWGVWSAFSGRVLQADGNRY